MLTATELVAKLVNKQGTISVNGLTFNVKTTDCKVAYGKARVCIVPLSGGGSRWIDADTFQPAVSSRPIREVL